MKTCLRNGCGKTYLEDDDSETACRFHPGSPLFHDARKGWHCCSKRVDDFDAFLKIEGCAYGRHSSETTVRPVETQKVVNSSSDHDQRQLSFESPGELEVDPQTELEDLSSRLATSSSVLDETTHGINFTEQEEREENLQDDLSLEVPIGTICKRKSCGISYTGPQSREITCVFHSGTPVFHEGSKGWSCCRRRVLDFDDFLKIQGCKTGKHRFLARPSELQRGNVSLRKDWYQTPTEVIVSIFAKNPIQEQCLIEFKSTKIHLHLIHGAGLETDIELVTFQPILPEMSTYEFFPMKVELTLRKANGYSWPSLEPTKDVVREFTTFGCPGKGTIGAKQLYMAQDQAILIKSSSSIQKLQKRDI